MQWPPAVLITWDLPDRDTATGKKPGGNASLTWVRNSHTLKAGFDGYWSAVPQTPYTNAAGAYTFSGNETGAPSLVGTTLSGGTPGLPFASFLLGQVDQFTSPAQVADYRESKVQLGFLPAGFVESKP